MGRVFTVLSLLAIAASSQGTDVNCGGHTSSECSNCPFAPDNSYRGKDWCHGECVWEHDPEKDATPDLRASQCRPRTASDVDCGYYAEIAEEPGRQGFFRRTCEDCVGSNAAAIPYCGGDCQPEGDSCVPKPPQGHADGYECVPSNYPCSGCINPATEWYPDDFRCGENPEFVNSQPPPCVGISCFGRFP